MLSLLGEQLFRLSPGESFVTLPRGCLLMVEAKNAHRPHLAHGLGRRKQILWASSEGGLLLRALVRLQPPDEIGNPAALPEH